MLLNIIEKIMNLLSDFISRKQSFNEYSLMQYKVHYPLSSLMPIPPEPLEKKLVVLRIRFEEKPFWFILIGQWKYY